MHDQSEKWKPKSPLSANTGLLIGCVEKIKLRGTLEANCAGGRGGGNMNNIVRDCKMFLKNKTGFLRNT